MRFILKLQERNLRWLESLLTAETEGTVRDEGFLAPAPSLPSEGPTQPNGGGAARAWRAPIKHVGPTSK